MKIHLLTLVLLVPFVVFASNINDTTKVKRYFFKDGLPSVEHFYGDDEVLDSLKTYYKSGNLNEVFYYDSKGRYNGECFQFNPYKEKMVTWTFKHGTLINRIDHLEDYNVTNETNVKEAHRRLNQLNEESRFNPKTFREKFLRANLRVRLGNYTLALSDFKELEKFIDKTSKNKPVNTKITTNVFSSLGQIYGAFEIENYALHYKVKAVRTEPNDGKHLYSLGAYLFEIKAYRLAISYFNETKKIWPKHAFSNWILGAIHSDLEDYDKALEFINMAFEREANLNKYGSGKAERDIRTLRGFIYHKLGDSEKGIADLEEALKINENNSFAYRNLGVVYHDLQDYDKACELLNKAKKLKYGKIHDSDDLQYYLEKSCNRKIAVAPKSLSEEPFIYPNPAVDIIKIKNLEVKEFNYELYNYQSQLVKKGATTNASINISDLDTGLYILNISQGATYHSFKIIKK